MTQKCPCGGTPLPENANHVRTVGDTTLSFCFARCVHEFDQSRKQLELDLTLNPEQAARLTA